MVFPVAKLGYLVIKQVSKPLAQAIKVRAKTRPWFRTYILMPPAQWYHRFETSMKMRLMGLRTSDVKPLSEELAVELGAEMLGETVIFSLASLTVFIEYRRQSRKERGKEDVQNNKLIFLEQKALEMGIQVEEQSAQIRELIRAVASIKPEKVVIKHEKIIDLGPVTFKIPTPV